MWAASKPNQSYDFSATHTNSDLDTRYTEAGLRGRYQVGPEAFVTASYRYLDFEDGAPYLGDSTGSADIYGIGVGWAF